MRRYLPGNDEPTPAMRLANSRPGVLLWIIWSSQALSAMQGDSSCLPFYTGQIGSRESTGMKCYLSFHKPEYRGTGLLSSNSEALQSG